LRGGANARTLATGAVLCSCSVLVLKTATEAWEAI
jgi:hypothetical protein